MKRRHAVAAAQLPTEFTLRDEQGRVWPPGFVSQLLDPMSPHSMIKTPEQQRIMKANGMSRAHAVATGEGWAGGYMGPMSNKSPKILVSTPQIMRRKH